jgi:predicted metal-dependent TIM-barrel fold hydrolase
MYALSGRKTKQLAKNINIEVVIHTTPQAQENQTNRIQNIFTKLTGIGNKGH